MIHIYVNTLLSSPYQLPFVCLQCDNMTIIFRKHSKFKRTYSEILQVHQISFQNYRLKAKLSEDDVERACVWTSDADCEITCSAASVIEITPIIENLLSHQVGIFF